MSALLAILLVSAGAEELDDRILHACRYWKAEDYSTGNVADANQALSLNFVFDWPDKILEPRHIEILNVPNVFGSVKVWQVKLLRNENPQRLNLYLSSDDGRKAILSLERADLKKSWRSSISYEAARGKSATPGYAGLCAISNSFKKSLLPGLKEQK